MLDCFLCSRNLTDRKLAISGRWIFVWTCSKIVFYQCYLFWYDNHKGWTILSTTTVNRVDSVGWKYLRRFYLAPLRGCAKLSAAESKLRPSLTRERKKLNIQNEGRHYFPTGDIFFCIVLSSVHTKNITNSSYDGTTGWETSLEWGWSWNETGSCCICR